MLQLYKNNVITEASASQADVRQRELDFYTNNYWIWGGTATITAGFLYAQLTNPVPEGTPVVLEIVYLISMSFSLGLSLCIITWTILCCIWGPGLALQGPDGLKSFHLVVDFLKAEQQSIYLAFLLSIFTFFAASSCIIWVYPSGTSANVASTIILMIFLLMIAYLQLRLEVQVGGSYFDHAGADGRIVHMQPFEEVADLDDYLGGVVPPTHVEGSTKPQPGIYSSTATSFLSSLGLA
mmetsp:Transcript_40696/g.87373  ORF Transcript_40696/g.87373 Transcript_40696/m.87373 type:complete len:238 (-) Transcript_40696:71-784(-)